MSFFQVYLLIGFCIAVYGRILSKTRFSYLTDGITTLILTFFWPVALLFAAYIRKHHPELWRKL